MIVLLRGKLWLCENWWTLDRFLPVAMKDMWRAEHQDQVKNRCAVY